MCEVILAKLYDLSIAYICMLNAEYSKYRTNFVLKTL